MAEDRSGLRPARPAAAWHRVLASGLGELVWPRVDFTCTLGHRPTCTLVRDSIDRWLQDWLESSPLGQGPWQDRSRCPASRMALLCRALAQATNHGLVPRGRCLVSGSGSLLGLDCNMRDFDAGWFRLELDTGGQPSEIEYGTDHNTFCVRFERRQRRGGWRCLQAVRWRLEPELESACIDPELDPEATQRAGDELHGSLCMDGAWLEIAGRWCGVPHKVYVPMHDLKGAPMFEPISGSKSASDRDALTATAELVGNLLNLFINPVVELESPRLMTQPTYECIGQLLPDGAYEFSLVQAELFGNTAAAQLEQDMSATNRHFDVWSPGFYCYHTGAQDEDDANDFIMLTQRPLPSDKEQLTAERISRQDALRVPECTAKWYRGENCEGAERSGRLGQTDSLGHLVMSDLWPVACGLLATQHESRLNEQTVLGYMARMQQATGSCCPTVLCYRGRFKERLIVLDGHHKLEAARRLARQPRQAVPRLNFMIIHPVASIDPQLDSMSNMGVPATGWRDKWQQIWKYQRSMQVLHGRWRTLVAHLNAPVTPSAGASDLGELDQECILEGTILSMEES